MFNQMSDKEFFEMLDAMEKEEITSERIKKSRMISMIFISIGIVLAGGLFILLIW